MRTQPMKIAQNRPARTTLAAVMLAGACAMGGLAPATAAASVALLAQAQDGTTHMVVDRNDEPLRCGDQDAFYAIARLNKGTVIQTAGKSGAYTRVVVPDSVGGFVPATEVEAAGAGRVKLRVDSRLRAPSQLSGLPGSWKQLYATALPQGTELEVMETLRNEAGSVVGYRVRTPKSPSGELPIAFILTDALRPALASEIDGAGTTPPSDAGDTDQDADQPAPLPESDGEGESGDEAGDETGDETGVDGGTPAAEPETVDTTLLEDKVTDKPVEITNRTPEADDAAPEPVRVADEGRIPTSELEDLEAAFKNARSMPRAELDEALDELLAEFTRTRDEAEDESLVRALDQRIEWIRIRIETRDQRRRIAQALAQYDSAADETAQAIEAWQQGRAYQLVGRMVTSSVYTGENLPLLYRVQGTDPITGQARTVGYIAPKKDQDLRHMLGRVVGVLGMMREDAALGLRVVEPDRVDLMPE